MDKLRIYLSIVILYIVSLTAQAQTTIWGIVTESQSKRPLPGVIVNLKPEGSKRIITFAETKDDGRFSLKIEGEVTGYVLQFSMMSYAMKIAKLTAGKTRYDVSLDEKSTILKEVTVKAPSIQQHGDTLRYNVASFIDVNDKSLADVLKKMPGIEVTENGEIKQNGKAINKFYIEGHDMLGGRYTLATNNIHPEDVATVEVMEKHQPIKALEDMSFSESPAINIKLKAAARNRLVGTMKIGGGVNPGVWEVESSFMRFSKIIQTLNTLKSNNVGTDVTKDGEMHFTDRAGDILGKSDRLTRYIDVSPDMLMGINKERVRKNQTHSLALNNLWAIGKNTDLSTQLLYSRDRLVSSSLSRTTYLLNDSNIINDENQQVKSNENKLSANIVLNTNTQKTYCSNTLSTDLQWIDTYMNLSGTYPNIQNSKTPSYKVSDNFELLIRKGKRAFIVDSYNSYMNDPHTLDVLRSDNKESQSVRSKVFFSHTSTSLGFFLKPFTIMMKVGIIALSRIMKSKLQGLPDSLGVPANDIEMNFFRAYVSPEAEYNVNRWNIKFSVPMSYTPYFYKDRLQDNHDNRYKSLISPRLFVQYQFSSKLNMSVSAGVSQREINEQNFYGSLIMRNYQNLYMGFVNYDSDKSKSLSINLNYKLPLQSLFFNTYLSRSWNESNLIVSRRFIENYILNSYKAANTQLTSWMGGGRISKGFGFLHGMLSLSTDFISFRSALLQNEVLSNYRSDVLNWSLKFNMRPVNWFGMNYEFNYQTNTMNFSDIDLKSTSTNFSQRLKCNINIIKSWVIRLQGEHYNNSLSDNRHKQLFLADISTAFSFKKGVELSLNVRNIFNQRTYAYTTYSTLVQMNKQYELRSRNIWLSVFFHL